MEYAWVIEHEESEVSKPRYLIIDAEAYEMDWSFDNQKALRFARREDASLFASAFLDGNGRIAEHGWETESRKADAVA